MLDVELIDGDLPERTRIIVGNDVVRQRVARRLQTHLGEFIADKSVGVPWLAWTAQKPFDVDAASAFLRAQIETAPGVVRLDDWEGSRSGATVTFTGSIVTSDGTTPIEVLPIGAPRSGNGNPSTRLLVRVGRR